ncbi:TonB-dependent receptor [Pseudomaricurvus alcaniphilus]|uniref:TonB-dependent receptor n=1 Tax=Pseudomaricurvus alcaniphilus TaxID=1166482 RepID=UPI00140C11CD|nr:TonB-dependent receptor [Pseudomaricurvus alcaniphilus]NHN37347.1 TonB-dependent receptor [Pseudomaricurvus alcaniphilus]
MDSSSIVEAISAEDIGKLADSSIAESLARLPGLAGERRNGRTSGLSVRGFKEDYVGTTMNGRELLGIGDNRGVEYDLYPSEIMSGAVVYKSPDATLAQMGIGGTVDLRTARPLDSAPTITINASYEMNGEQSNNPDFDDTGHRAALSFSQRFADDTIGVALALATTESPTQEERNGLWGYTQNPSFGNNFTPDGMDTAVRSTLLERDTAALVLQFRPNEKLDIKLDALYIDFADTGISRGFIEALPTATADTIANGAVTAGTTAGFHSVIRSDPLEKLGELKSFGANFDYQLADTVVVKMDVAHSETTKNDLRAESYAGVGRAGLSTQGDPTTREWQLNSKGLLFSNNSTDFGDFDMIKLAGPQAWGGSLAPIDALQESVSGIPGVGFAQAQDGFVNEAVFEEELDTFRLEAVVELSHDYIKSVNFGVQYSDRFKSKDNTGAFITASTWPLDGVIPEEFREGVADLSFAGLGNVVAYDALSILDSEAYRYWDAASLEPDRLGDTYTVSEEVLTLFAKFDFETDIRGVNFFGNFGMQMIDSEQESTGFNALTGPDLLVQAAPIKDGDSYRHWLPSLNMNFDFGDGHMVRAALAKVISRARIDHLGPGSSIKFRNNIFNVLSTDPEDSAWQAVSGNAQLKPLEANQFDISYDWYFEDDGYISVGYFYKDLVNWHANGREIVDFSPFYIPGFHQAVDTVPTTC